MGPEISCLSLVSCLMSIKLPMYLLFILGGKYGFGWGSNPLRRAFEGVGPEISTFLGPKGPSYARSHFRAQKSFDFRAHPKCPSLYITPPSKAVCPTPYKQQVH
jgi:hypothetical protein